MAAIKNQAHIFIAENFVTKQDVSFIRKYISNSKAEMIKWLFIFWIGQVTVTFGFILMFLKR